MYRHSADSIMETSNKVFVTGEEKSKYASYNDRFREKSDIYTKSEIDVLYDEMTSDSTINVCNDQVNTFMTKSGVIDIVELQGHTIQELKELIKKPTYKYGALDTITGEEIETTETIVTQDYIPVRYLDELSYKNTNGYIDCTIVFYKKDRTVLSTCTANAAITVPLDAVHMKVFHRHELGNKITITIKRLDYEAIKSVGDLNDEGTYEIPVKVSNNLFNGKLEFGYISTITGTLTQASVPGTTNSPYATVDFIECEPNTVYTISRTVLGRTFFYDKNKEYIDNIINEDGIPTTFTTPSNCKYIKWHANDISHIQNEYIVKGELSNYSEYTTVLKLNTPLDKLDDISDKLIKKDGKWVIEKNITDITLQGGENWELFRNYVSDGVVVPTGDRTELFQCPLPKNVPAALKDSASNTKRRIMSTKFITTYGGSTWDNISSEAISFNHLGKLCVRISKAKIPASDATTVTTQFRTWLEEHQVKVKYPMANPIYIELPEEYQFTLNSFDGGTSVEVLSSVRPNMKIKTPTSVTSLLDRSKESILKLSDKVADIETMKNTTCPTVKGYRPICIEDTSDGIIDDISIEGNTLVNLATVKNVDQLVIAGYPSEMKREIIKPGTFKWTKEVSSGNAFYPKIYLSTRDYGMFVPGRKYTVKYKIRSSSDLIQGFAICNGDAYIVNQEDREYTPEIIRYNTREFKNYNEVSVCFVAKKPEKQLETKVSIGFGPMNDNAPYPQWVEIMDLMIVEGDHTTDGIAFFEGIKSVEGDINVKTLDTKVNLCEWYGSTTVKANQAGNDLRFIPFTPTSDTYTIKILSGDSRVNSSNIAYRLLDRYGRILGYRQSNTHNAYITTAVSHVNLNYYEYNIDYRDVAYLQIFWNSLNESDITIDGIVAVDGHIPAEEYNKLSFRPAKTDTRPLMYLDTDGQWKYPVLRKVTDKVRDTIEKHSDGKYYYHRRTKEQLLVSNPESGYMWDKHSSIEDDERYTYFVLFDEMNKHVYNSDEICVVADKLVGTSRTNITMINHSSVSMSSSRTYGKSFITIKVLKTQIGGDTLPSFKAWLDKFPVNIVYQYQEQIFECMPIDLPSYNGNTVLAIENSIIYPKVEARVNNNISEMVNKLKTKIGILESDFNEKMVIQNKIMLDSRYCSDKINLRVEIATRDSSYLNNAEDLDLYNLICKNILAPEVRYTREEIEDIVDFYTMIGKLSLMSAEELFSIISKHYDNELIDM